jgi:hypothetical protein
VSSICLDEPDNGSPEISTRAAQLMPEREQASRLVLAIGEGIRIICLILVSRSLGELGEKKEKCNNIARLH